MWYDGLFEEMEQKGDEAQAQKMSAYMQNRFPFMGIAKPLLKEIMKPYLQKGKKLPLDWDFVFQCWDKPYREAQYVAVDYVLLFKKKLVRADFDNFKRLITEKSWWETVDNLDVAIGLIVLANPDLKETMLEWAVSDNLWLRRVAIDFQQEYKGDTDTELLEEIISRNLGTDEFFINKAIGWSLRDYSKTNPEWVRSFLTRHKGALAPLSVKEATKYL